MPAHFIQIFRLSSFDLPLRQGMPHRFLENVASFTPQVAGHVVHVCLPSASMHML